MRKNIKDKSKAATILANLHNLLRLQEKRSNCRLKQEACRENHLIGGKCGRNDGTFSHFTKNFEDLQAEYRITTEPTALLDQTKVKSRFLV